MTTLILGGSGSGKSQFAESRIVEKDSSHKYYIATMHPFGEEGRKRVERHRKMREKKQMETIECYRNLHEVKVQEDAVVLVECMSNLLANELFDENGSGQNCVEVIWQGICSLMQQAQELVIVSNDIFADGITYDKTTMDYMKKLGILNQKIAEKAEQVYEVVAGIPILVKGEI